MVRQDDTPRQNTRSPFDPPGDRLSAGINHGVIFGVLTSQWFGVMDGDFLVVFGNYRLVD